MVSKISEGVNVSVETFFQTEFSNAANSDFMFAYKVTIENTNSFPVKLLSRHWVIFDSNGTTREVNGEGVVGMQPVIHPTEKYQYVSGCNLNTDIGKMKGSYLFENILNKRTFSAVIPSFEMYALSKLN